jgi:2'-hydroxyisoflavone reductase
MFNRGMHNPELFPEVERIKGDRKTDIELLKGRKWDAVIDTCGYVPSVVKISAEALKDSVGRYVFISSVSVYSDFTKNEITEDDETGKLETDTEEITGETYGPLKVLCENTVKEIYEERALVIRPGLIVGPDDPTDRFTYWAVRLNEGGKAIAPASKNLPAQFIDVRDLADWTIHLIENRKSGTYNATGPAEELLLEDAIKSINEAAGNKAQIEWIDENFLSENEVAPWSDLPLWLPANMGGMASVSIRKALNDGLKFTPLEDTVKDTLEWVKSRKENYHRKEGVQIKAGLAREKEKELLEKWALRKL